MAQSTFDAAFKDYCLPALWSMFAEDIAFTHAGGAAQDIQAVYEPDPQTIITSLDGETYATTATFIVKESDVATAAINDTIEHRSATWVVESVEHSPEGTWNCRARRSKASERSNESHRIRRF